MKIILIHKKINRLIKFRDFDGSQIRSHLRWKNVTPLLKKTSSFKSMEFVFTFKEPLFYFIQKIMMGLSFLGWP